LWGITAATGVWFVAAVLLWRTAVPPDLPLPRVSAGEVVDSGYLARSGRYERGLRLFWLAALAAELTVLGVAA
jgi:hypothetical protein